MALTADAIAAMRRAQVIVRYGIGVDNVDLKAAATRGIPVCNVPDYCIDEVADHTLAMILTLTRRLQENTQVIRDNRWTAGAPLAEMRTLRQMTIGVIGFDRIGREVTQRLRSFGCKIQVHDRG